MSRFKFLLEKKGQLLFTAVKYGCIVHLTNEYVVDVVLCQGPSMEPTLTSDNVILCEHISPALGKICKGDIVVAKSITNPSHHVCKRILGLEGDLIWSGSTYDLVPRGHVWLEGDNASNSTDSRDYGPVPYALIRGRVLAKLWPISEMRWLTKENESSIPSLSTASDPS